MDTQGRIAKAAGVMSAATLISRILGYIKDMIIARYFGATGLSDTFFVAFRIPNLLRELFAEGSMSSAFIPVITEYQTKHGASEAQRLIRIAFTFIVLFVGAICIAGIILSPILVALLAPGFMDRPEQFSQTVFLTRIMFPFLLFISLAALVMGALNTRRVFFIPALAPAFLNITIIIAVILLVPLLNQPIAAVALGVCVGGFVQFLFQIPSFYRSGFTLSFDRSFSHPGLRKMATLVMPGTMGMAVAQINIFISTILASFLAQGSVTYLYYSMRLIQFPVGIFGVAMGMAALPALSEHVARNDIERLREDFSFTLRLLFFITVPAMAGLIALKEPIVNILFQRGVFDYQATVGTADALLFYSLGIWAIVGARIVTAAFYSFQDTKTPVKVAVVALSVNILLGVSLMGPMQHSGLACATSIASSVNFILLFFFLRKRLGRIDAARIMRSFVRICIASAVMGGTGWFLLQGDLWTLSGRAVEKAVYLSGTMLLCMVIYFTVSFVLGSEEVRYVYTTMKDRFRRNAA